jgi:hypothetical protein
MMQLFRVNCERFVVHWRSVRARLKLESGRLLAFAIDLDIFSSGDLPRPLIMPGLNPVAQDRVERVYALCSLKLGCFLMQELN